MTRQNFPSSGVEGAFSSLLLGTFIAPANCWITRVGVLASSYSTSVSSGRVCMYLNGNLQSYSAARTFPASNPAFEELAALIRAPKSSVLRWGVYRTGSTGDGLEVELSRGSGYTQYGYPPQLPNPLPSPTSQSSDYNVAGFVDYVSQVAPTPGAFTAPAQNALINGVSVAFQGTTPHGNGDGAYDRTINVQLQIFESGTNVKVYDETFAPTQAQWESDVFSRSVSGLTAGKTYYARYRHQDTWGVWSTFSADRTVRMAQGPDAPTPLEPLVLLNAQYPTNYRFEHSHPEGRSATAAEVQLRNAAGTTVLWNSGTRTLGTSAGIASGDICTVPATGGTQPNGTAAHPQLAYGTGYSWWARVRDSLNVWGPYSNLADGAFRTNSTPDAPRLIQPVANAKTGDRLVRVDASDPDGDPVTAVQLDLVRVSTGSSVSGYPKQMTVSGSTATFEIPQADVVAGVQYRYRARATDGKASGYGPYSGYTTFTYVVSAAVSLLTPPQAQRTNLIPDPSFEYESNYWSVIGDVSGSMVTREASEDVAYGQTRRRMTKATGTETTDLELRGGALPVDSAKNWRLRGAAKKVLGDDGTAPATDATFGLRCLDAAGVLLGYALPHDINPMDGRDLEPYWRPYGGLVRPVGTTTGSIHPAFPAGTTQVEPFVFLSGGAQEAAVDAFMFEEVPAATDAEWARLSSFYGYLDPDLPGLAPGGYDPAGAYGGSVGAWVGDAGNSGSRIIPLLNRADGNSVLVSYSHPAGTAKVSDRLIIERLKANGVWERHHESLWRTTPSLTIPIPDNLFRNERRYRAYAEVKDANDIVARTQYTDFVSRYQGPPELAVLSYSADPQAGTVTINFEASGLTPQEFGGVEVARECEETGEELRTVALITDPAASSYTYHFPVSSRTYRYHVRQVQLVGPERIEGRYRSVEASVDYSGWNFVKSAVDPSVMVRFQHASGAGPAFPREKPTDGYAPWGALAPVHLFGEGEYRSGTTAFLLYPHPDLPEPRERLKVLKRMRRESGALCLLTDLPDPEKTWIALTGPVTPSNAGKLISVELAWTQTSYVEDAYAILGAYDEETA